MPDPSTATGPGRGSPYAWVIVAVVAVTLTIASGERFLFDVVLKPVSEEFGWNRAQLTGTVMLAMIVISIFQPLVGILVDRIGPKSVSEKPSTSHRVPTNTRHREQNRRRNRPRYSLCPDG